jgi:hypothetical protein
MPIRLRIALATAAIMIFSLLILGSGIYLTTARSMHDDLDVRLNTVYDSYRRNPGRWHLSPGQIQLLTNLDPFASSGVYIQILHANGAVAARSENLGDVILPIDPEVLQRNAAFEPVYYTVDSAGQELRIYSAPISDPVANEQIIAFVQVAEPLGPLQRTLGELKRNLIIGGVLATIVLTESWDAPATSLGGSTLRVPVTTCRCSRKPSTTCSPGWKKPLTRNADSSLTHRTSCGRRSPPCGPIATSCCDRQRSGWSIAMTSSKD